jgi:hypothetical protein
MAPEQHLGVGVDARTDQFSYCVALYEALYGKRPFRGQDMVTLMEATLRGLKGLPPPQNDLPLEVRTALRRGLQPEREARFDAMEPLIEVLERASGPVRSGSGGWPWIVMGGAALVVFTAGLTLWLASDSSDESDPTLKTPEVSVPNVDGRRSRGKPAAPMGRAAPQGDEVLVPEFSVTTEDRLLPSIEELADPEPEGSTGATTGGRGAHEGGTEAAPRSTTEGQPALESPPPVPESLDASTGGQPLASPGGA